MTGRVGMLNLTEAVNDILTEYGDAAMEAVKTVVPQVGKEAVKKLRADSPKDTGGYSKGWKATTRTSRLSTTVTIYNKDHYQVAHLLEHGHAKRGGGRTAPIAHIKPVEDWANEEVTKRLREVLG